MVRAAQSVRIVSGFGACQNSSPWCSAAQAVTIPPCSAMRRRSSESRQTSRTSTDASLRSMLMAIENFMMRSPAMMYLTFGPAATRDSFAPCGQPRRHSPSSTSSTASSGTVPSTNGDPIPRSSTKWTRPATVFLSCAM